MKWSAFTEAVSNLRRIATAMHASKAREEVEWLALCIEQSVKFYFPSGMNVLEGKKIHDETRDLLELPFDIVSVLSEVPMMDATGDEAATADMITVAVSAKGHSSHPGAWALIASAINIPGCEGWQPSGCQILVVKPPLAPGISVFPGGAFAEASIQRLGLEATLREMQQDVVVVTNLCAMLGLGNVRKSLVEAPKRLNEKRQRNGKLPLWSYHVLEVDGERWEKPDALVGAQGRVFRSHLRRGHIRRLADGRRVWVRASFVHGAAAGFVHKDYRIAGPSDQGLAP